MRLVNANGHIKWRNQSLFLSSNLTGEYVAFTEEEDGLFTVSYGALQLGHFDCSTNRFTPRLQWSS